MKISVLPFIASMFCLFLFSGCYVTTTTYLNVNNKTEHDILVRSFHTNDTKKIPKYSNKKIPHTVGELSISIGEDEPDFYPSIDVRTWINSKYVKRGRLFFDKYFILNLYVTDEGNIFLMSSDAEGNQEAERQPAGFPLKPRGGVSEVPRDHQEKK